MYVEKKTGANALEFSTNYEKHKQVKNDHPEQYGQYLCPDIDMFGSLDEVANMFHLDKYQKYKIICDIFSDNLKVNN